MNGIFRNGMESMEATRKYLKSIGLPETDNYRLQTSEKTFEDGSNYRIEVPTVNSVETFRALMELAEKNQIEINKIDETIGVFRHTREEIKEYINIAKYFRVGLNFSIGPRATYDLSPSQKTEQGKYMGYRLRGEEQIVRAIEDVKRFVDLGGRGIIVYDEGLLWILNRMRSDGIFPDTLKFKNSAHNGHGNPASIKLLEELGADTINPVRDLALPMISAIRESITVPLDIHIDNPPQSGGFIRTYETPEIVRIASPVYLKTGNSALNEHGQITTYEDSRLMFKQALLVKEMLNDYYPNAIQGKNGSDNMCVPE